MNCCISIGKTGFYIIKVLIGDRWENIETTRCQSKAIEFREYLLRSDHTTASEIYKSQYYVEHFINRNANML